MDELSNAQALWDKSLASINAALPDAERLLFVWVMREMHLESAGLKAQVEELEAKFAKAEFVDIVTRTVGAPVTREERKVFVPYADDDEVPPAVPCCPKCGRIFAQDGDDCPNGCNRPEKPEGSATGKESLQVGAPPSCPYQLDPDMPAAEARRIKAAVSVARTSLKPWQFCRVVEMRLKNATPTQIAGEIGVKPSVIGAQLRAADRHIKEIAVHPREGWRSHYMRELWDHIERGA